MKLKKAKNLYLDCLKGNALCCKDNMIDLTTSELSYLYDKAPIVITFGLTDKGRENTHFSYKIRGKKLFIYLSLAMLVKGGCVFLDENRCGIYENRPIMCRAFPLKRESTLKNDLKLCKSCGDVCLNSHEGFPILSHGMPVEGSFKKSESFHREHLDTIITLKEKIFEKWFNYMLRDEQEISFLNLLVEQAFLIQQGGNNLWIKILPDMEMFFKDFFSEQNIDTSVFFDKQLKFYERY